MSFNINRLVQSECGTPNPLVAAAQQIANKPASAFGAVRTGGAGVSGVSNTMITKRVSNQLVREFVKLNEHNHQPSIGISMTSATGAQTHAQVQGVGMVPASNSMSSFDQSQRHAPPIASAAGLNYNSMHNFVMNNPQRAFAAEQLETKYRNDMISLTEAPGISKDKTDDDVQFWQSLSQQYMGPNTFDTIAKVQARQRKRVDQPEAGTSAQFFDEHQAHEDATKEAQASQIDELNDTSKWFESIQLNETDYVFDERNPLKDQYEDPFAEGLKRLKQGDIPSAALLFEAAVQKEPENSLVWRYLGTTQAQNEKDTSAIRALRNCLRHDPHDQGARLAISVSLVNETKHHEACKYLLEWLINHERYKSVSASLSEFHEFDDELSEDPFAVNSLASKHYEYVMDKFMTAARMSPNNPDYEVQNSLGVLFNMRGHYEKAVDCFKAALSVRSSDSLLWNRLGATLANGNKSDEAVIAYRRALEISPGFLRSRYNLAISLIHLNLYDEAAKQLVQILNMQAAGKGSKHVQIRTRSITSTSIWNTLRTVATLMNKPHLYPIIDGRDLARCNDELFKTSAASYTNKELGNAAH